MSLTGLSAYKVQCLLTGKQKSKRGPKHKLTQDQVDYLISEQTLKLWKAEPLKQRCVLFHRQYPDTKLSHMTLHRLYCKHKITFKKCITKTAMTDHKKSTILDNQITCIEQILKYKSEGKLILYLDETNFMAKKHEQHSYAKQH